MPRFYITTPIYYVTDAPHLGTAYSTVNADAIARWHRLCGDEVKFLTGTDEHGAKVAESAEEHGLTPEAWADHNAARFVEAWRGLDIAYDDFLRTTEQRHTAVGPVVPHERLRERLHLQGHLPGPLLRELRGLLHR